MRVTAVSAGGGAGGTVTDRWFDELRAGRAFALGSDQAAGAALFSHVQLLNPAASGVNIIVYSVYFSVSSAAISEFRRYDTALVTLTGNGTNLLIGGAAAIGEVRRENNAAALGTPFWTRMRKGDANPTFLNFWSVELGPGEGMLIAPIIVNIGMTAGFFWNEVAV